jgi:hypothetical protein
MVNILETIPDGNFADWRCEMINHDPLKLDGYLLNGGTTGAAQEAFLRDNYQVISDEVAPRWTESTPALVEWIKPRITQIEHWRRRAEQTLHEIIRQTQLERKQAAHEGRKITTRGRPPAQLRAKVTVPRSADRPSALPPSLPTPPQTSPIMPVTMTFDDCGQSSLEQVPATPAPPAFLLELPPMGDRPKITTMISQQDFPRSLKNLLMSYVKGAGEAELIELYAQTEPNWRARDLPNDIIAAMWWIHELSQ